MHERLLEDRYELEDIIGRGGMARVFRALDRKLNREVAVKMLLGATVEENSSVERFRREARAAAGLNHPNIVSIYDWGETDGTYYMVMELVDGENLKQLLGIRRALPETEALDIAAQVAGALQAAHEHGVIHRDIKPQNILVDHAGRVKVTDFGIARAAGLTQITATDVICGTPHYLSPEQAQQHPVDHRADIYSLGAVLYEMLTGREPFSGSPLEVAMQHVSEPAPSPRLLQPGVSPATEAIVTRALAKEPAQRFASAGTMEAAIRLARTQASETVPAPPLNFPTAGKAARPGASGQTTQWRARIPPAEPRRRRDGTLANPWLPAIFVAAVVLAFTGFLAYLTATRSSGSPSHHLAGGAPTTTAAPRATGAPKPTTTSIPATTAPGLAVAANTSDPAQTVLLFYRLVSKHRFADAASLWTPALQAASPPDQAINQRFAHSTISVEHYRYTIGGDGRTGKVRVQLLETKDDGSQQQRTGSWDMVLTPARWLMNASHFNGATPTTTGPPRPPAGDNHGPGGDHKPHGPKPKKDH